MGNAVVMFGIGGWTLLSKEKRQAPQRPKAASASRPRRPASDAYITRPEAK
jgi:hypothetical protein